MRHRSASQKNRVVTVDAAQRIGSLESFSLTVGDGALIVVLDLGYNGFCAVE
jgi:hypothetical protein